MNDLCNKWNSVRTLPEPGQDVVLKIGDIIEIGFYNQQNNLFITNMDEYPVSYIDSWQAL